MTSNQSGSEAKTYSLEGRFVAMNGVDTNMSKVIERIASLQRSLPDLSVSEEKKEILGRACRGMLGQAAAGEPDFQLRPHTIGEIERISDEDLPRYLYYRYRYDVFPVTLQTDAYPPCVQIEPTSICNYRCVFCYQADKSFSDTRHGFMGQMSLETFKRVVDQLVGNVEAVTLASRGEPLACRDIEEMLAYVGGKFLGLKMNTNASLLDEKKAHAILQAEPNTLVFSADAADPELYSSLRVRGKLDKVLKNVERFAEIRAKHYSNSRTITRVSGVKFSDRQNFEEINAFWSRYVDQVAFVEYNPWKSAYETPPNGILTPCSDLWRRALVMWDGRLNPCIDADYKASLCVGSVLETPLTELWQGAAYRKLRADHQTGQRQCVLPCNGCAVV